MLDQIIPGKYFVFDAKPDNGKFPTQLHIIPCEDGFELVIQVMKTGRTVRESCKISRKLLEEMGAIVNAG